ncbi:MAG: murein biosynthesis integral membrane protein MurJ [Cardiobacteriaceae bacterium]|nr:murein biosynthesis integral membrane protein MurJ [Cardiobacteriaceae bacterium]
MSKSAAKSSLIFAAMTLISRLLGLLRDILIARFFPAGLSDIFFAAQRIPNTLRRFFAEGGFANAFVPVFSATKAENEAELKNLLAHTFGALFLILSLISLLGVIFSSTIFYFVAKGIAENPEKLALGSSMLAIMFPYILLISLTAMCGGILNTYGKFALPALTPAILNLAVISACFWRKSHGETDGTELAWAVLGAGVLQLAVQLPFLFRLRLLVFPLINFAHQGVRKIIRLMIPTLFGSSVGQFVVLFNTFIASHLAVGSISWLYYTDRLVELPTALIGVALGTVILPRLSALKAKNKEEDFSRTLNWALRWGILVGTAAAIGLAMTAEHLLAAFFYGGKFTTYDVERTAASLQVYSCAALFLILVKILAPAFYARQDTKTPVKIAIVAMLTNVVLAVILSRYFAHIGLAMSATISAVVNVCLLTLSLKKFGFHIEGKFFSFIGKIIFANLAMAVFLYLVLFNSSLAEYLELARLERILRILITIISAAAIYALALFISGIRPRSLSLER